MHIWLNNDDHKIWLFLQEIRLKMQLISFLCQNLPSHRVIDHTIDDSAAADYSNHENILRKTGHIETPRRFSQWNSPNLERYTKQKQNRASEVSLPYLDTFMRVVSTFLYLNILVEYRVQARIHFFRVFLQIQRFRRARKHTSAVDRCIWSELNKRWLSANRICLWL